MNSIKTKVGITTAFLFLFSNFAHSETCGTWSWGCDDDWGVSLSVPAIKLKQGEKAKLFEGIAAGLQLNRLLGKTEGSLASGFILTPAFMLSTTNTINQSGNSESDYVFSTAILAGFKKGSASFQIGYSYDVMSSQSNSVFDKSNKGSILLSIGTSL